MSEEKTIGVVPMESKDILLQGQTKYVQFTTPQELTLVQHAIDENEGMIGMGLKMFDTGVLPTMPLLEIEQSTTNIGGSFGMFAKLRAVGRVRIDEQPDDEQNDAIVTCKEVFDQYNDDDAMLTDEESYEQANHLADDIEALIADMSAIERMVGANAGSTDDHDDRMTRFQQAYDLAMTHDYQGYTTTSSSSSSRSWQELSAIAWAAYSTSTILQEDATFRLNAMNMQSVLERLDMAVHWLSDVQQEVEQRISQ